MAKKRKKKSRSKRAPYAPRQPKSAVPAQPKMEQPKPAPAPRPQRPAPARRASATRPTYAGRTTPHLAAMNLEEDNVMYSYVRKDLKRIGIFSAIMFGSLVVLKLLGVA